MLKSEWKNIFKTPLLLASIFAVAIVPILYTGMFLWAFWDPYGSLSDLPVAVVNEDKGASYQGEQLDLGNVLTEKLVDGQEFKFKELSKAEAVKGFNDKKYYMVIEIPEKFSEHATTLLNDNPSKLTIQYDVNQGYNFLGSQIGQSAIERIRAEVNKKVSATYAEQLFTSVKKLANGYNDAADGATKVKNGIGELANGTEEIKSYLQKLSAGAFELSQGTSQLTAGAEKAANGAAALQNGVEKLTTGSEQLQVGAQSAAQGSNKLQQGLTQYTNGVDELQQSYTTLLQNQSKLADSIDTTATSLAAVAGGVSDTAKNAANLQQQVTLLSEQLQAVSNTLPEQQASALKASIQALQASTAKFTEGTTSLATNTGKLSAGMEQIATSEGQLVGHYEAAQKGLNQLSAQSKIIQNASAQLANGNATLSEKLGELSKGLNQANAGATQLASSLQLFANGSKSVSDGTNTLASKSMELANGSEKLTTGATQLVDGSAKLANKLGDAGKEADKVQPTDATYDMVANPVDVDKKVVNEVPNYGTGFAPYFISLGLAVGALILSTVYPFVEPASAPTNATSWFNSKLSVFAVVGLLQAIIVSVIVVYGVGVDVSNMPLFLGISILASYTFIAMIQLLVTVLKDAGRFAGLLLLILQLTTSAGTFPIELIPKPLQVFYGKLPMTYTIEAFRSVISMDDYSILWHDTGVLVGVIVICVALTYVFFQILFKHRYSKGIAE